MSSKKRYENLTVMRSVQVPLSESELQARKTELPVVIQKQGTVEDRKKEAMSGFKAQLDEIADTRDRLVREINSGHTIQDLLCPKVANLELKEWTEVEDLCQTEIPVEEEDEPIITPEVKILALPAAPVKEAEVLQEDVIQGEVVKAVCAHCANDIDGEQILESGYAFCSEVCRENWLEENSEGDED